MAYERNDRGFRGGQGGPWRDRESYGREGYGRDRFGRDRDYGRQPQGYDYEERGFFDRAGDEVRSWFGDEDAERRRRADEREDEQHRDRDDSRGTSYGRGYAPFGQREERGDRGYGRNYGGGRYGADQGARSDRYGSDRDYGSRRDQGYGARGEDRGSSYRNDDRDQDRGYGQGSYANYGQNQDRGHHDESYRTWRDRQMESFDRDYQDYRRENQSRFESDFTAWRTTREGQRSQLRQVREHQDVVGSDGQHVGTVDHVDGDRIKLTKNDKDAAGQHHYVPCSWVKEVGDKVTLNKTAAEAKQHWTDEARNAGGQQMFGREQAGAGQGSSDNAGQGASEGGSRNLNRSFSGTY